MNSRTAELDEVPGTPQMVHMGFASKAETRLAKNSYYARRGEDRDPGRALYVKSRDAWRTWRPGDALPRGAEVVEYDGLVPEVLREDT